MKKLAMITLLVFVGTGFGFAATAEELLFPVYAALDAASQAGASAEINTVENTGKKVKQNKKSFTIKAGKKAKALNNKATTAVEPGFYPECLFNLKDFLADFDLSVTAKDERIKLGKEEIIAVRKGQPGAYPQVRIIIKKDEVLEIRFYSMTGKKYYVLIVNKYKTINGAKIPSEITETVIAKDNNIEKHILYSK